MGVRRDNAHCRGYRRRTVHASIVPGSDLRRCPEGCTIVDMRGNPRTVQKRTLRRWRENYDKRDDVIRAAYYAGLSKMEIHKLTGISRTTIDAVLKERREATACQSI